MNGSATLEGHIAESDATIVSRILAAGGRITGKATCEDLCLSGGSYTSLPGPVRNPHDQTKQSGGSSSGSGALVAAGEVDLAIACDQGGSIRIPSCWCGVVGLKPTHGLVPYSGIFSMEPSFDHCGPVAKTVADCALFLQVLAGRDGLDTRHVRLIELHVQSFCLGKRKVKRTKERQTERKKERKREQGNDGEEERERERERESGGERGGERGG